MINYLFVLDINSNEILFDQPKEAKNKYKTQIKVAIEKIKPITIQEQERGRRNLEDKARIYYQRLNDKMMAGAIAIEVKKESDLYRLFADLNAQIKQTKTALKENKELEAWLNVEIGKFNKGERMSAAERINNRVLHANDMVEAKIAKELEKFEQLEALDKEVIEMETMAKSFEGNAAELHKEALLYNRRLQVMMWGGAGLAAIIVGIWMIDVIF